MNCSREVKAHIPPKTRDALKLLASAAGMSVSTYIREVVLRELIERKTGKPFVSSAYEARGGSVYIIKCGALFKIGRAVDVRKRIASMSLPMPAEIVATYNGADYCAVEKQMHEKFAACRTHGEWFALSAEQLEAAKKTLEQ